MITVFIGGSRRIGRMNPQVAHRLDNIILKQMRVLIGDANGFDRIAQDYLARSGYQDVVIYCTEGVCRNNVGNWRKQAVAFQGQGHGLEFYTAKDDAMLGDADYGFFAWDGKSKGTLRNIQRMAEQGKVSVVYASNTEKFITIRNSRDAEALSENTEAAITACDDLFMDIAPNIKSRVA